MNNSYCIIIIKRRSYSCNISQRMKACVTELYMLKQHARRFLRTASLLNDGGPGLDML